MKLWFCAGGCRNLLMMFYDMCGTIGHGEPDQGRVVVCGLLTYRLAARVLGCVPYALAMLCGPVSGCAAMT
ncbi:hypothetical protein [Acetobacter fallax]|uniref:Uncharacterized protein n=1 Tax=Acetobacter fallax TaxID=1737473 RepID=A0ABX0K9X9_9PROT|nr:hypothetical protein [Acetobacter fallax]NHO31633.1 hypothetical protein [Acetobacter fallax]NHO35192.1 hypothetical protein [Acetobacter fallax]